ncbi:MAG: alkaline phosphatase family protein [Thermoanaerobaculales bacterium]|nr:alkaline phosphatase family protein [Thermoanaerobaculales bacterium]
MARERFWIHGLTAGAAAGVLAGVLVMRLNPEIGQPIVGVLIGTLLWASWGAVVAGGPIVILQLLLRRVVRWRWPAPGLIAVVYLVAAVLAAVNADLDLHLLSATARRVVQQDAVAWFLAAILALLAGAIIRRLEAGSRWRIAFAVVMVILPAGRLVVRPTTAAQPLAIAAEAIGSTNRPLLVVGVEGLDVPTLLTFAGAGRTPALERATSGGAWGTLQPYEPFLRHSYWTSVATGAFPGAHGVKAHWGWDLPWLGGTLRLMPWTPQGSRLILPWWLARRVQPPPSTVPALWQRIRLAGIGTEVLGWPGVWPSAAQVDDLDPALEPAQLPSDLRWALEVALEDFGAEASRVWPAVQRDQLRVDRAIEALAAGDTNVWLHLGGLATARQELEPLKPSHTGEREVVELMVEVLDHQLGRLLAAAPPDSLIVLVSPYGLSPPSSLERLRRLIGIGDTWRTSGDRCWDGVLVVMGRDVVAGRVFQDVRLPDIVPTMCYLLGLPLAQYMEGAVVIDAVDRGYLASHPLVVDP